MRITLHHYLLILAVLSGIWGVALAISPAHRNEVPYDSWFQDVTGRTFNSLIGWERNNFDRVVHFACGLLFAYPIR